MEDKKWIELYSKISGIKKESRRIICDLFDATLSDLFVLLEVADKEKIDSVREYMRWLRVLKDNIENPDKNFKILKQKEKTDTLKFHGLRKIFGNDKNENKEDRLKRMRDEWSLQPR